jgi:hypothetical protein
MTSQAQRIMLFSYFGHLANARRWTGTEQRTERNRITRELFGEVVSWGDLDNSQVDRLKARLIALRRPPHIAASHGDIDENADWAAAEDGERRRLVHRIESDLRKAALAEGYIRKIALDQCDRGDWRDLPIGQLTNLRDTLAQRIWRRGRKKAAEPVLTESDPF